MEENWITYTREFEEGPTIHSVDLAFLEQAPDAGLPHVVRVAMGFAAAEGSGFPEPEVMRACDEAEELLVEAIGRGGGVLVGRGVGHGERDWYFYVPDGRSAEAVADEVMGRAEGREWTVDAMEDPQWRCYSEHLLPTAEELRRAHDAMVVMQLEQSGDPLTTPRPVRHFIYFEDPVARQSFVHHAEQAGFTAEMLDGDDDDDGDDDEADEDDAGRFGLMLEREDAVDLETISGITTELMEAAEEAGGEYDGWEAMLVRGQ